MIDLSGKTALVTGGSRGIGRAIAAVSSLGALRAIPMFAAVVEIEARRHFPNRDEIVSNARQKTPAGHDVPRVALAGA